MKRERANYFKIYRKARQKERAVYLKTHQKEIKSRSKAYYRTHQKEIIARSKAYNKIHQKERAIYLKTHQKEIKAYDKAYRKIHRKKRMSYSKTYYKTHRKEMIASNKIYRDTHRIENTVRHHLSWIFGNDPRLKTYHGMPVYHFWNPKEVGNKKAVKNASRWVRENIGEPKRKQQLHILPTGKGFRPGNLVWADSFQQNGEKMAKIIAELRHQIAYWKKRALA